MQSSLHGANCGDAENAGQENTGPEDAGSENWGPWLL